MRWTRVHRTIALLVLLTPAALRAQRADSPIEHSPYLALGGDPLLAERSRLAPISFSAGIERAHSGSRWSLRLGADYRRTTTAYSDTRWEDFGVGVTARYGMQSGLIRPYLLGGVGVADLRTRGRWLKYDSAIGTVSGPVDSSFTTSSRLNGSITSGFGADVPLGHLRFFTEARANFYPARLSGAAGPQEMRFTKAFYFGVKF
jgi:hypothetical protein